MNYVIIEKEIMFHIINPPVILLIKEVIYLKNEYNNKITNKKIEKNKSFEYFPSFTIIDNKINISLMGNSKSNRNLQALKKPYIINKSNENIYYLNIMLFNNIFLYLFFYFLFELLRI